jgi:hypothetical protein
LRELTEHEIDEISDFAVKSAENFIFSRISKKEIKDLHIDAELHYGDGLDFEIVVEIFFDELSTADEAIADQAADHAVEEVDRLLESLSIK